MQTKYMSVLAVVLITCGLWACSGGGLKDQVAHKWRLNDVQITFSNTDLPDSAAFFARKYVMNKVAFDLKSMNRKMIMDFASDGSFKAEVGHAQTGGTWDLRNDSLIQRSAEGRKMSYRIDHVNADSLILTNGGKVVLPMGTQQYRVHHYFLAEGKK